MIRDTQNIEDDICRDKRLIKEMLINDPDIVELLNNPNISSDNPEDLIDINIFDYIRIPGTISEVKNYICFDIDFTEPSKFNDYMKIKQYIFYVYCHSDNIKTNYGVSRHDLLGYLIRENFAYSNKFGIKIHPLRNTPGVMDSFYSSRKIIFEQITTNDTYRNVKMNRYESNSR